MITYPLEVDGRVTRVLHAGDGNGAVVFLHGGMTNANRWKASLDPIAAEGWRALALDLPGRGFCLGDAPVPVGVHDAARFVISFLDTMEIETAVLVGASFGGHLAAAVACDFPERIEQVVLIGPVGLTPWDVESRVRMWDENLSVTREMIAQSLHRQRRRPATWDEVEEAFRMRTTSASLSAAQQIARYMTSDAWEADAVDDRLEKAAAGIPTLVIWGSDDKLLPVADAYELQARLPGSHLAVIEGAEHDADLDCPDVVHAVMAQALHRQLGLSAAPDGVVLVGPR